MAEIAERVENHPDIAYERSDWPIGTIFLILLMVLILLVITPVVLLAVFPRAASDVDRAVTVELPEPRLQTDPSADLTNFRAQEEERLNGYYWIDKKKGIVHIPIGEAMKIVAEEGID